MPIEEQRVTSSSRARYLLAERTRVAVLMLRVLPGLTELALVLAVHGRILRMRHLPSAKRHLRARRGGHAAVLIRVRQILRGYA